MLVGKLRELLGFFVGQRQRLFDEHVLAGLEKFLAQRKMRLCRRDNDHGIHFVDERLVIRCESLGGHAELARGFELFFADFGHIQFDGQIVQVTQVIRTRTGGVGNRRLVTLFFEIDQDENASMIDE
jgi:hypothetical protein